jgi:hypothetical protein
VVIKRGQNRNRDAPCYPRERRAAGEPHNDTARSYFRQPDSARISDTGSGKNRSKSHLAPSGVMRPGHAPLRGLALVSPWYAVA